MTGTRSSRGCGLAIDGANRPGVRRGCPVPATVSGAPSVILAACAMLSGLFPEHVHLPEVLAAERKHRVQSQEPGLADAGLQVTHLAELVLRIAIDRRVESALPHHQDPFRLHCELGVQAQIAEEVPDDRALELVP